MAMRGGGGGFRHGGFGGFRHAGFRHGGFHHGRRHWGHRGYGWGYYRPVAYVGSCWVTRPRVNYFGEVVLRKFWVC
jgi:hypothetical protein